MSWQRSLYSLVWRLATPLIRRYLKRRARKAPAYLQHWDERFGATLEPQARGAIWIHAVSVGETRAALPLVKALRQRWPDAPLLLTQMTPTGRATAASLYPDAEIRYLPYDYPQAARDFLAAHQPRFGVLMETELWPNLIHAAHEQGLPLFLANARLSEKSLRGYRRIQGLIGPALRELAGIAAQTGEDAGRLLALGAPDAVVCGNTKYDFTPPQAMRPLAEQFRQWTGGRAMLVCASTRDGEEALILAAWRQAQARVGNTLLLMVPRHPERFAEVAATAEAQGFIVQQRSEGGPVRPDTQVWLGDSMGELFAYYGAADLAFVGGSLQALGGQNLIEPASLGLPVLFGPSMFNFADASAKALEAGAAMQVEDAGALVDAALALLADETRRQTMGAAALAFTQAHQGASRRIVELIAARLAD